MKIAKSQGEKRNTGKIVQTCNSAIFWQCPLCGKVSEQQIFNRKISGYLNTLNCEHANFDNEYSMMFFS